MLDQEVYGFGTLPFYKMLFKNKLEFSSLIDCLVWISESVGEVRFTIRFSSFRFIVCSMGKRCHYKKIKCNKRKNNDTFKSKTKR
jgi:hypothetical protein